MLATFCQCIAECSITVCAMLIMLCIYIVVMGTHADKANNLVEHSEHCGEIMRCERRAICRKIICWNLTNLWTMSSNFSFESCILWVFKWHWNCMSTKFDAWSMNRAPPVYISWSRVFPHYVNNLPCVEQTKWSTEIMIPGYKYPSFKAPTWSQTAKLV